MELSISNIAWSVEEDLAIYKLLKELGVSWLEIAPTRIWGNPIEVSELQARQWREQMHEQSFSISSFQALLFGKPDLILFGSESVRQECQQYLKKIINLASWVGAKSLVFGSPKNRLRGEMRNEDAFKIAEVFFRELGDYAGERECCVVIEANPVAYGCDFIQNMQEAKDLVCAVDSSGFKLHIDTGELSMNQEDIPSLFDDNCILNHVHLSEPMLEPLKESKVHNLLSEKLKQMSYNGFISIEMKRSEPVITAVTKAVELAKSLYLE